MFINLLIVPERGIEPPPLARHDFESCASTNSATPAIPLQFTKFCEKRKAASGDAAFGRSVCHRAQGAPFRVAEQATLDETELGKKVGESYLMCKCM